MKKKIISRISSAVLSLSLLFTSVPIMESEVKAAGNTVTLQELITTGNLDVEAQDDTFQFSVATKDYNAYMWVPEDVKHLTGLVTGVTNLVEPKLMYSATLRQVCKEMKLGIVYYMPHENTEQPAGGYFSDFNNVDGHAGEKLDEMMSKLAAVSGYDEVRYIPFITTGHSAMLSNAYDISHWYPNRVIAQIAMAGGAGGGGIEKGVPMLSAAGQFTEHWTGYGKDGYFDSELPNFINNYRSISSDYLISPMCEYEAGHYDWSEQSNQGVAFYIRKAVQYRINPDDYDADGKLKEDYRLVDLTDGSFGYLASIDMFATYQTAALESEITHGPSSDFTESKRKKLLWFFDKEHYEFTRDFTIERKKLIEEPTVAAGDTAYPAKGKRHTFVQMKKLDDSGEINQSYGSMTRYTGVGIGNKAYEKQLENDPTSFSIVTLKPNKVPANHGGAGETTDYDPDPEHAAYLVPEMAPMEWVGYQVEEKTDTDSEDIAVQWRNYMRWKNNRVYYRQSAQDCYVNIVSYDNDIFSYAVGTFQVNMGRNNSGLAQKIQFDEMEDVSGDDFSFTITPTSSAGLPVDVMVEYGPAKAIPSKDAYGNYQYNADGSLTYTIVADQVPENATYPIEVRLVASQFGASAAQNNGEAVQQAEPVERTFYITKEGELLNTETGFFNGKAMLANGMNGLQVEGNGTIVLSQNQKPGFTASMAEKNSRFPDGYQPTDYWLDYHNQWSAKAETGFIPFSAFTKGDKTEIDLSLLNQIEIQGDITSVEAAASVSDVSQLRALPWGNGQTVLQWSKPQDGTCDLVRIYKEKELLGETNLNYITVAAEKGDNLRVVAVKDGQESSGVMVEASTAADRYMIDDFEKGDLQYGIGWIGDVQGSQGTYGFTTYKNIMAVKSESLGNHYLGLRTSRTGSYWPSTISAPIPGTLSEDVTALSLSAMAYTGSNQTGAPSSGEEFHILLSGSKEDGTHYEYCYNAGLEVAQSNWTNLYIPISSFITDEYSSNGKGITLTAADLENLDTVQFGRRNPSNTRVFILLDNISFTSEANYQIPSIVATSAENAVKLTWENPEEGYDELKIYQNGVLLTTITDPFVTELEISGLTSSDVYTYTFEVVSNGTVKFTKDEQVKVLSEKTITAKPEVVCFNGEKIQSGNLMVGRGRCIMMKVDMSNVVSPIKQATLSLSYMKGTGHGFGIFLMPGNDWSASSFNSAELYADEAKTYKLSELAQYKNRTAVYPGVTLVEAGNDTDPGAQAQGEAVYRARYGALTEAFYDNYTSASTGSYGNIDITNTLRAAMDKGQTEATLLCYTPFGFSATCDFYGPDVSGVTEEQLPTVSIVTSDEQKSYETGIQSTDIGTLGKAMISGIPAETTVTELGIVLQSSDAIYYVKDKKGNKLSAEEAVSKGDMLYVKAADGTLKEYYLDVELTAEAALAADMAEIEDITISETISYNLPEEATYGTKITWAYKAETEEQTYYYDLSSKRVRLPAYRDVTIPMIATFTYGDLEPQTKEVEVTIEQTDEYLIPEDDTYLDGMNTSANRGTGSIVLSWDATNAVPNRIGMIRFDLKEIKRKLQAEEKAIKDVTFTATYYWSSNPTVDVYVVDQDWTETTATYADIYTELDLSEENLVVSGQKFGGKGSATEFQSDAMLAKIQAAAGADKEFITFVMVPTSDSATGDIATKEHEKFVYWPKLYVDYEDAYQKGDVNRDGKVTAVDALLILQASGLTELPTDVLKYGDMNGDGILNQEDATAVLTKATESGK
ncbi:MAG: dockerin type I domain-containing protein [Lachnospiraceae bacterium]